MKIVTEATFKVTKDGLKLVSSVKKDVPVEVICKKIAEVIDINQFVGEA